MQQHLGIPLARSQPYNRPAEGGGFVDVVRYKGICGHHRAFGCGSQQLGHCSSPALLQRPTDDSATQGALRCISNLIPANFSRHWAPSSQHLQYTQRWKKCVKYWEHSRASQLRLNFLFLVPFGKPPTFYQLLSLQKDKMLRHATIKL